MNRGTRRAFPRREPVDGSTPLPRNAAHRPMSTKQFRGLVLVLLAVLACVVLLIDRDEPTTELEPITAQVKALPVDLTVYPEAEVGSDSAPAQARIALASATSSQLSDEKLTRAPRRSAFDAGPVGLWA